MAKLVGEVIIRVPEYVRKIKISVWYLKNAHKGDNSWNSNFSYWAVIESKEKYIPPRWPLRTRRKHSRLLYLGHIYGIISKTFGCYIIKNTIPKDVLDLAKKELLALDL